MSANFGDFNGSMEAKISIVDKLQENPDYGTTCAVFLPDSAGILVGGLDKTVKIQLKRERGHFWPSCVANMADGVSALYLDKSTLHFFVGLTNGQVKEYSISDDYNVIDYVRDFSCHAPGSKVTAIVASTVSKLVYSVATDQLIYWNNIETGERLTGYSLGSSPTCLSIDADSNLVFIGDTGGQVTMLSIISGQHTCRTIRRVKQHTSPVKHLYWCSQAGQLISSSRDKVVCVYDIKGSQGAIYELRAHNSAVMASHYFPAPVHRLISVDEASQLVCWEFGATVKREPPSTWTTSDYCERCSAPFFWNLKSMWNRKQVGGRRHHCRKCGVSVCEQCSRHRSKLPRTGYEQHVRLCNQCGGSLAKDDTVSLASGYALSANDAASPATSGVTLPSVVTVDFQYDSIREVKEQCRVLTVHTDNVIRIWDISSLFSTMSNSGLAAGGES